MTAPNIRATVDGVPDVLRTLRRLDPELRREAVRNVKAAADPMKNAARSLIPDRPLSGWSRTGRLGFTPGRVRQSITVKFRSTARGWERSRNSFELVRLVMGSPAGSVFDMAGRASSGTTPQGRAMVANLNRRHGSASRAMWRAADTHLGDVQRAVIATVDQVAANLNRDMS